MLKNQKLPSTPLIISGKSSNFASDLLRGGSNKWRRGAVRLAEQPVIQ
jgi:hypothetical protein